MCGEGIQTIQVICTSGADFAIGEFGICCLCAGAYGSCCDPHAGDCADDVEATECLPPLQFFHEEQCAELNPPCGNPGCCCDEATGTAYEELEEAMLAAVQQWCFAHGQQPHPLLPAVVRASLEAIIQRIPGNLEHDGKIEAIPEEQRVQIMQEMASFVSAFSHHDPVALDAAMAQFNGFMESVGSPQELF